MSLANKKIILGVTGGIAAYKAAELCRLLVKAGAEVRVVMTAAAQQFVAPLTFQALSGKPVLASLWEAASGDGMEHIHLSRDADLLLVAPASADFLARLVHGRADDLLSTLCLARTCTLAVAPAMNREMWAAAPTQRNLAQLRADGVQLLGPAVGEQACGETGLGRMLEPAEVVAALPGLLGAGLLAGKRVLITAGPTFEAIDPVRGLTNRSSGKMGYAVAQAAREAGAEVCLVSGPTCLAVPAGVRRIDVQSAAEMRDAVLRELPSDVFIAVAAVADYRVDAAAPQKIKKSDAGLTLNLVANPDILAEVAALPNAPFCVGFAAETERLAEHAEAKRRRKHLPLLVGNLAQDTLGQDTAELVLFDDRGAHPLPRADKLTQARHLIRHLASFLN
ncbi:MAG: bifunctional phosphopantothenoylcysteine decarboxylase/phosphopantothenate--cysteine ligase CoaBC [Gammaproteobacteria bacterium]|nr:bifunctional phosphopantothenoylcysteine decarboxylase/phosphopantothenate--cysteine ligase CoaBC [Gammaproteobacteria bacterium]MBU1408658.1 bifunctional phosphopantothenoylcysteine decarboxylase/phosphopantothenate--cysteine ligase CoaBC [Gammaproteobacteria bacterium]MBU1532470.1 bifunctional phosphopantothenoylcysteine decarboxylase/phosphopantothenate--cysteine ligase CoaBC [Gammaproteobacteria bacterium]